MDWRVDSQVKIELIKVAGALAVAFVTAIVRELVLRLKRRKKSKDGGKATNGYLDASEHGNGNETNGQTGPHRTPQ